MAEGLRAREHHVRVMPYVGGGMNATGIVGRNDGGRGPVCDSGRSEHR